MASARRDFLLIDIVKKKLFSTVVVPKEDEKNFKLFGRAG